MTKDSSTIAALMAAATRRSILYGGIGLGVVGLAEAMGGSRMLPNITPDQTAPPGPAPAPTDMGVMGTGQFPARARRVLHIMMWGGFSQADTFDYKPMLIKMHGQEIPPSVKSRGGRVSGMSNAQTSFPLIAPIRPFKQYGQSGMWVSDLLPHMGGIADELCLVKSVWSEHVNHDPAAKFLHTGFQLSGRPSTGSWVNYALGSDNANLPAFVAMHSGRQGGVGVDASAWGSGFLPSQFQGVPFGAAKDPVLYVSSPDGVDQAERRDQLDLVNKLAKAQYDVSGDTEIMSKVATYEMAYRMQQSVPEVVDFRQEPQHILDMYGPDAGKPGTFAHNAILARRLLERNVKFVQLMHMGWDQHSNISTLLPQTAAEVDQPVAALVRDLKQRGLLEDTLVVISTEFGRTSFAQGQLNAAYGRDHHGGCFTYAFAGAGIKAGHVYGETDDFSYNIAKDPVHIHDVQATLLHLLGIDHKQLTYRYQGRDFRLTDVAGEVVHGIIA